MVSVKSVKEVRRKCKGKRDWTAIQTLKRFPLAEGGWFRVRRLSCGWTA